MRRQTRSDVTTLPGVIRIPEDSPLSFKLTCNKSGISMNTDEQSYLGVICVEMFQIDIAVFPCLNTMVDTLISRDVDADPDWKNDPPCNGMAVLCKDSKGCSVFAMMIDPDSDFMTWAHEISHIVDMIFSTVGIPGGIENTETRAYMTGHIWEQLEQIIGEHHDRNLVQESEYYEEILPGEIPIPTYH